MAENDSTSDEAAGESGAATRGASAPGSHAAEKESPLSRFGGGFATIAGGVAAFVLMLAIGGFVAFQLLGGPGDGAAPGPVQATGPSQSDSSGGSSSGSGSGSGSGGSGGSGGGSSQVSNPEPLVEPNDQDDVGGQTTGNAPQGAAPGDFGLRLSKESAEPYEDVRFRGRFTGASGQTLLLQNKVGSDWVDYREDATVRQDGSYRGTFSVGAVGVNEFRVADPRSGQVSNVVSIEIY